MNAPLVSQNGIANPGILICIYLNYIACKSSLHYELSPNMLYFRKQQHNQACTVCFGLKSSWVCSAVFLAIQIAPYCNVHLDVQFHARVHLMRNQKEWRIFVPSSQITFNCTSGKMAAKCGLLLTV